MKPQDVKPSELVALLLSEGVVDHDVIDFPRKNAKGEAICQVHVRLLSDEEQALAIAGAFVEMQRLLVQGEVRAHATLEHNLTVRHMLAEACRGADDSTQRFFRAGAAEVKQFNDRELAELWLCYLAVKERSLPSLGEMTDLELRAWAERVEAGVAETFPFYLSSHANAQGFFTSVARCLAALARENDDLRAENEALRAELEALRSAATPATPAPTSATGSSGSAC